MSIPPEHGAWIDGNTQELFCADCGDRTPFPLPMDCRRVIKRLEAYALLHKDCEKKDGNQ